MPIYHRDMSFTHGRWVGKILVISYETYLYRGRSQSAFRKECPQELILAKEIST